MIEALCKAALFEQSVVETSKGKKKNRKDLDRKRLKEAGITGNTLIQPSHHYQFVHMNDEPITIDTFVPNDPLVRSTFGKYVLIYLYPGDPRAKDGKRFIIMQDLIRARLHFGSIGEFYAASKRVVELGWLARNTTLTRDLFKLAMITPGTPFVFTIKHVEYANMIIKKMEERGIDTYKNSPFVAHPCSWEDWEKKYKHLTVSFPRDWRDYHNDLKKVTQEDIDNEEQE